MGDGKGSISFFGTSINTAMAMVTMVYCVSEYGISQSWWDHFGRLDHDALGGNGQANLSLFRRTEINVDL